MDKNGYAAQRIACAILSSAIKELKDAKRNLTSSNGKIAKLNKKIKDLAEKGPNSTCELKKYNLLTNEKNLIFKNFEENKNFIKSKWCAQLCELAGIDHIWFVEVLEKKELL